jgi:hypothetical protein
VPVYCYSFESDGKPVTVDHFRQSMDDIPERVYVEIATGETFEQKPAKAGGFVKAKRDRAAEMVPAHDRGRGREAQWGSWPIHSHALAFHPRQVTEQLKREIGADIDADGCVILENPQHRREVMRREGIFDRSGYFDGPP